MLTITSNGIRKQNMAVTEQEIIEHLLLASRVGYLGLVDGDEPYVVPLNYLWYQNAIYIHGAQAGRKATLMGKSPKATFTVANDLGNIANPVPAKTDTAYLSVMVFGTITLVPDLDESTAVLQAMLNKYVPGYYDTLLPAGHVQSYVSGAGSHVGVYRLQADKITAKQSEVALAMMFYPGRTRKSDV